MTLAATLERLTDELTPVERRISQALLASPTEAAFLSVQELARRADADAAAAVRLAKKLGFSGYRALKASLQSQLVGTSPHERLQRRVQPLRGGDVLGDLIDREIESLNRLREQVDGQRILLAARSLRGARRIHVYGEGHATALVDLLSRRLNRHGYLALAVREGQWSLPEAVAGLDARDLVVAFAFYRVPDVVPALLAHAHAQRASSILVTDLPGLVLPHPPTHLIAAVRGRPGESHTLGVPMVLVNALTLALARLDGGRSLQALARLDDVSRRFDPRGPARPRTANPSRGARTRRAGTLPEDSR